MSQPALAYVGPGAVSGVPARDLTEHDLDRLVYVRKRPRAVVVAGLVATRFYRKPRPAKASPAVVTEIQDV